MVVHTFNPALARQRQAGFSEFEPSLVHRALVQCCQEFIEKPCLESPKPPSPQK